ncbi:MAG: BtrH N-terminal domain-containing protein [Taibaiella sp.]|nr:BtrH N-terminal domain-containing protein [Taibaiella sp.]
MDKEFKHYQHAHCESGVTANMLRHEGIDISEPMAFGIGSGIFFGHLPFLKVGGIPGTTYRLWPGAIFKKVANRLDIKVHTEKFSSPANAMKALDTALAEGRPTGILGSVFYLPYLPEAFRFHFNAHNFIAYGKQGSKYLISDPIMEGLSDITPEDLVKARFAKGTPEPRGFMYYITGTPKQINLAAGIEKGIKQTCNFMLNTPLPWFGNSAIFLLANRIKDYPHKLPPRKAALYLGNVIRMQEEIGTGGAGFRYLYAAFLQEAGIHLRRDDLQEFSAQLTKIGDGWRNFAYNAARIMKVRNTGVVSYDELSALLRVCGEEEKIFFTNLGKLKW